MEKTPASNRSSIFYIYPGLSCEKTRSGLCILRLSSPQPHFSGAWTVLASWTENPLHWPSSLATEETKFNLEIEEEEEGRVALRSSFDQEEEEVDDGEGNLKLKLGAFLLPH